MEINLINVITPSTGTGFNGFLVDAISWLTQITSSIALGIILFTVILKLVTLPFDFMSRYSMRKNSVKMEQMRPELEKLQKQYAGDKALYNQKMLALQKKNGYSMWGACLPTILTLVIFIVAINGFTSYSNYQNREYYYEMANAYNSVIYNGIETDGNVISRDETGKIIVNDSEIYKLTAGEHTIGSGDKKVNISLNKWEKDNLNYFSFTTENGYVTYQNIYLGKDDKGNDKFSKPTYSTSEALLDGASVNLYPFLVDSNGKKYGESTIKKGETEEERVKSFLEDVCSNKSAEEFRNVKASFLWVKNIWVTDSPLSHPVNDTPDSLAIRDGESCACNCSCSSDTTAFLSKEDYNKLTAKLEEEKTAPNGYFILVILTAASSLLMQLVTSKSQKAQMELQTVDGQGAQTQKMMTWMMPILMAVFAFMYTSAFAIYIILSSFISLGTTFLINYIVNKKFKIEKAKSDAEPIRGRVYVPKTEPEEKKPVKKSKKKEEENVDFLFSASKNRHIRGRKK